MRKQFGDVVEELAAWLAGAVGREELSRYGAELAASDESSDSPVFIINCLVLLVNAFNCLWVARYLGRLDIAPTLIESLHTHATSPL